VYPAPARFGLTGIHYIDRVRPQIAWLGHYVRVLGVQRGVEVVTMLIESCYSLKACCDRPELALLSCYRCLVDTDWYQLRRVLKARNVYLECLDSRTGFVRCYSADNPLTNEFDEPPRSGFSAAEGEIDRQV